MMLPAATDALRRGWNVLPVGASKRPHLNLLRTGHATERDGRSVPSWKPLQTERVKPEWLTQWFTPEVPGMAVVTGAISGLVVLDFDGAAGQQLLKDLGLAPNALSGSGSPHVYVEHPGHHVRTIASSSLKTPPFPGLDIRGDGGMAVLPPSQLDNGPYRILNPTPLPVGVIPESVAYWAGLLSRVEVTLPEVELTTTADDTDLYALLDEAVSRSTFGRNNAGYWLARQLAALGVDKHQGLGWMQRYQAQMPQHDHSGRFDPYTLHHARSSLDSAYSSPVRRRNVRSAETPSLQGEIRRLWPLLSSDDQQTLGRLIACAGFRAGGREQAERELRRCGITEPAPLSAWAEAQAATGALLPGLPKVERWIKVYRSKT